MPKDIAIISAESGGEAVVTDPRVAFEEADYYLFSDASPRKLRTWTIMPLTAFSDDTHFMARRNARICKVLPHAVLPGYKYYIWHDATHELVSNPATLVRELGLTAERPFAFFRHCKRISVYEEAREILRQALDHAALVRRQVRHYRRCGFPAETVGLFESGAIVRMNSALCRQFEYAWWEQICRFSSRDQLSLSYALWRTGVGWRVLSGTVNENELFQRVRENRFCRSCTVDWRTKVTYFVRWKMRALFKRVGSRTRSLDVLGRT